MKFYYKYKVLSEANNGSRKWRQLRADNPIHLVDRFKQLHKSEKIIKWQLVEDS